MIWIQAGFAMTVLSAAIKAIPDDIVEAARIDGVTGWQLFRYVTAAEHPARRSSSCSRRSPSATLKVFDIVRTMTGGQFDTSVVANEFYTQTSAHGDGGLGAALAVLLFVLVIPIIVYNIRQMRSIGGDPMSTTSRVHADPSPIDAADAPSGRPRARPHGPRRSSPRRGHRVAPSSSRSCGRSRRSAC